MRAQETKEIRDLTVKELDAVNDGVAGGRGCTTVLNPNDPRFKDWVLQPNPWIAPPPIITGPLL